MAKTVDQIMAEMAAQGITVSTSRPKGAVTEIIRESAKRAGNYWCSKCRAAADHDDEGHLECTCWVDERYWFSHMGAIEPGSQKEYDPECPEHGTAPSSLETNDDH